MNLFKQTVIIVEDELPARQRLRQLLLSHPEIEILAEAANGEDGLVLIHKLQPDLIFLDIQMPVLGGFEMLSQLKHSPKIIFTTAFEEFAIKAFEQNSIDYLLKPFSAERLQKALEKMQRLSGGINLHELKQVMDSLKQEKKLTSITVSLGDRIIIVPTDDIPFLKSEDKCTVIHDAQGKQYLIYTSLQKLVERLPENFLQVHRAFIINKNYIREIRKGFKGQLIFIMEDGTRTPITTGKTFVKAVREELEVM